MEGGCAAALCRRLWERAPPRSSHGDRPSSPKTTAKTQQHTTTTTTQTLILTEPSQASLSCTIAPGAYAPDPKRLGEGGEGREVFSEKKGLSLFKVGWWWCVCRGGGWVWCAHCVRGVCVDALYRKCPVCCLLGQAIQHQLQPRSTNNNTKRQQHDTNNNDNNTPSTGQDAAHPPPLRRRPALLSVCGLLDAPVDGGRRRRRLDGALQDLGVCAAAARRAGGGAGGGGGGGGGGDRGGAGGRGGVKGCR